MYKGKQEEFKMCLSFLPSEESGRKAGICLCWWAVFSSGRFALDVSSEWQSLEMACYWMSSPIHRSSLEPVQQLTDLLRTENYQHELWQHLNIAVITGISSEDRRRRKGNGAQQVVNCQTLSMITWSWNDTFIQKQRKKHTGKPNHARAKPISRQKKTEKDNSPDCSFDQLWNQQHALQQGDCRQLVGQVFSSETGSWGVMGLNELSRWLGQDPRGWSKVCPYNQFIFQCVCD